MQLKDIMYRQKTITFDDIKVFCRPYHCSCCGKLIYPDAFCNDNGFYQLWYTHKSSVNHILYCKDCAYQLSSREVNDIISRRPYYTLSFNNVFDLLECYQASVMLLQKEKVKNSYATERSYKL